MTTTPTRRRNYHRGRHVSAYLDDQHWEWLLTLPGRTLTARLHFAIRQAAALLPERLAHEEPPSHDPDLR